MEGLMLEAVLSVIIAIAGIIGVAAANYLRNAKRGELKYEIIAAVVMAVQQVYDVAGGEEKYRLAVEWVERQFKAKGLDIDPQEIDLLVEQAVKSFKLEFGDRWYE